MQTGLVLLIASPLGVLLAIFDARTRELYYRATRAAVTVEQGGAPDLYQRINDAPSKDKGKLGPHSLWLAVTYLLGSALAFLVGLVFVSTPAHAQAGSSQVLPWWVEYRPVFGALAGVVLGFVLALGKEWITKHRERKSHWQALDVEIDVCSDRASMYLKDGIASPSYRLPVLAFEKSLPALLADGQLSGSDYKTLLLFYSEVETLNRGLDQANEARDSIGKLGEEVRRNQIKAAKLIDDRETLYTAARKVLDKHVK